MNKTILRGLSAAWLISAAAVWPAQAEEVDEIIVSATGIPTPAAQIGASVDVITAEDLERQQIVYLQDALKLKGINVPQNGGPGTLSNVFLRGLPGKYSDLQVDGISMYDPRSEQVLWQDVVADGVDQVEILRGSQGLLFGSNSIAGVVSQFTAIGGESAGKLRLESGEFGTGKAALSGKGSAGMVDYGYAVSSYETDGISAFRDPSGEDDGYENTTLHGVAQLQPSDALTVDLVLRQVSGESEFDGYMTTFPYSFIDLAGEGETFERQATRLAAVYRAGALQHSLSLNNYDAEIDSISSFVKSDGDDSSRSQSEYRLTADGAALDWVFGLEDTQISREISGTSYEADNSAVYGMLVSKLGLQTDVTIGARQDDHQHFGTHATYRGTLAHAVSDRTGLRFAYGTGFRAPTLYNLYSIYGNTALQPETSVSMEAGIDRKLSATASVSLTAYQIDIDDLIDWVSMSAAPYGRYEQIVGTSETTGAEFDFAAVLGTATRLNLDAVYTDSKQPDDDGGMERRSRTPRLQAGMALSHDVNERLTAGASVRHVKGVVDGSTLLEDYTLWSLRGAYRVTQAVQAYARIENAADEDYETVSGYGTPGRAAYVGVTTRF